MCILVRQTISAVTKVVNHSGQSFSVAATAASRRATSAVAPKLPLIAVTSIECWNV